MLIGLVLGGALAIGAAIMAENSDPTVRSYHDLSEVTGVQLLASIPVLLNPKSQKRRRRVLIAGFAATAVACAVVGLTVWHTLRSENIETEVTQPAASVRQ
jgi:hypothetical protein